MGLERETRFELAALCFVVYLSTESGIAAAEQHLTGPVLVGFSLVKHGAYCKKLVKQIIAQF